MFLHYKYLVLTALPDLLTAAHGSSAGLLDLGLPDPSAWSQTFYIYQTAAC